YSLLFLPPVLSLRSFAHSHPLFSALSIYIAKKGRVVAPRRQSNKDQTKKDQADLRGGGPTVRVARRNIT
ncbi:MAG TPA: hypothetical protein VGH83_06455, partial [Candidatus Acidoferrum sp.]